MISVEVENAPQIEQWLKRIEQKTAKKVVRKAVRAAQRPTLATAKGLAKAMIGGEMGSLISKNIKIISPKQKRGSYRLNVDVSNKANDIFIVTSKSGTRNYIPAAIEYGHGSNKDQSAIPFQRTANFRTEKKKVPIFSRTLKQGIEAIK